MLLEGDTWYLILITASTHVQTYGVTDIPINTFYPPLGHRLPLNAFVPQSQMVFLLQLIKLTIRNYRRKSSVRSCFNSLF